MWNETKSSRVPVRPVAKLVPVAQCARKVSRNTEGGVFSSVDLYRQASRKYPELNRKSFNTTVISAAPEHTSWKYYRNGKDYLVYLGKGKYRLRESTE